jgi:hypothetical protein
MKGNLCWNKTLKIRMAKKIFRSKNKKRISKKEKNMKNFKSYGRGVKKI